LNIQIYPQKIIDEKGKALNSLKNKSVKGMTGIKGMAKIMKNY